MSERKWATKRLRDDWYTIHESEAAAEKVADESEGEEVVVQVEEATPPFLVVEQILEEINATPENYSEAGCFGDWDDEIAELRTSLEEAQADFDAWARKHIRLHVWREVK